MAMQKIYIEHNPFTVITTFRINELEQIDTLFLSQFTHQRLQRWIEGFFQKVYEELFNGIEFEVEFKGTENDYIDVQADIDFFNQKNNLNIQSKWIEVADSSNRLNHMKAFVEKAQESHLFSEEMQKDYIQNELKKAFSNDFDVYVAATMSAGKSTFLNALLGSELLPAANEATTAVIAQIADNKALQKGVFKGKRITTDGNVADESENLTNDVLKNWNNTEKSPDTAVLEIEGNILGIKERDNVHLILSDTPGPNNSQDDSHKAVTEEKIKDTTKNPLICYLLNATQIGTNDDKHTLEMISETINNSASKQNKDRFLFLLNKADQFDEEKGENIENIVEKCRTYLNGFGIEFPQIYPITALNALLLRKEIFNFELTRKEGKLISDWKYMAQDDAETNYKGLNFIEYMPLNRPIKQKLAAEENKALLHTGIPAVEAVIDNYIDKYSMPERVSRVYEALKKAIQQASAKERLMTDLKNYKEEIANIKLALEELSSSERLKIKVKAEIEQLLDEIKNNKHSLGRGEHIKELNKLDSNIFEFFAKVGSKVSGKLFVSESESESEAKKFIEKVIEEEIKQPLQQLLRSMSISAEKIVENSQEQAKQKLQHIYQDYLEKFFKDIPLPLPTLEGLKVMMTNISSDIPLTIDKDDIIEERKTRIIGERSLAKWYNPLSWWKTEYIKESYTETSVDLESVWKKMEVKLKANAINTMENIINKIQSDTEKQIEIFSNFTAEEFSKQLSKIAEDMNKKLADQETIEQKIQESEANLEIIKKFEEELAQAIAL
ncbi:dynamin family protein [Gallibacterium melopsittaci]|uniref:Dynamin family protein n=1 Tax=Gallibacterium melopsittaci TaxID=516063 RepID=A0ABV6HYH4_9PAST